MDPRNFKSLYSLDVSYALQTAYRKLIMVVLFSLASIIVVIAVVIVVAAVTL